MLKNQIAPKYIALLLFSLTLLVYLPVIHFDFLSFDDRPFITGNPYFAHGINLESLKWIFSAELLESSPYADYWQPLSFLSHLIDIELFGFNPAAHHLVSALWHALNAVLVFYLIRRLFRQSALSFMVAAAFAWHPVQVEAVAWIISRKHLIAAFFSLCGIHAYLSYVKTRSGRAYAGMCLALSLSLMAKISVIVFPFLLLLLDIWPLKRLRRENLLKLLQEKAVLIFICALLLWIPAREMTNNFEQHSLGKMPLLLSILITNIFNQLRKVILPFHLGIVRSLTFNTAVHWPVMISGLAGLAGVTGLFIARLQKSPWLLFAWLWFLMNILPVSILRFSSDRFLYFGMIGMTLGLVWISKEVFAEIKISNGLRGICAAVVLLSLSMATARQLSFWKDDETFYKRGIEISGDSYIFNNNLGNTYANQNKLAAAINSYEAAMALLDKDPLVYYNLAQVYVRLGHKQKAMTLLQKALEISPEYRDAKEAVRKLQNEGRTFE